jgi:putative transposase
MQRKINFTPGEYYHLYSRGVEKRKIFLDHKDHERFMALLYIMNQPEPFNFGNFLKQNKITDIFSETKEKSLVSIISYTLMPNHFHILVYENQEGGISKFMLRLLTAYSMYFNTKYERSGPLFVHPFRSQHISNESHFMWLFSYIHLNPIKIIKKNFKHEGIGNKKASEDFLDSYKYSGYHEYKGISRPESKIIDISFMPEYIPKEVVLDIDKYKEWFMENNEKYRG